MGSSSPLCSSPRVLPAKCSATISLVSVDDRRPGVAVVGEEQRAPGLHPGVRVRPDDDHVVPGDPSTVLVVLIASTMPPVSPRAHSSLAHLVGQRRDFGDRERVRAGHDADLGDLGEPLRASVQPDRPRRPGSCPPAPAAKVPMRCEQHLVGPSWLSGWPSRVVFSDGLGAALDVHHVEVREGEDLGGVGGVRQEAPERAEPGSARGDLDAARRP